MATTVTTSKLQPNVQDNEVNHKNNVGTFVVGSIQNLDQLSPIEPKVLPQIVIIDNTKFTICEKIRRKFRRLAADDLTGQSLWSLQGSIASDYPDIAIDLDNENLRGHWNKRIEFLLSCIGYAVGLGNIWRFPFKCYEGGGGAFLIPYFILLVFAALPIFFMELSLGQFASLGPISIWNMCPAFRGIGISMVIICIYVCLYYNVIIAWSFFYVFKSFSYNMPWVDTINNTLNCPINPLNTTNETRQISADTYWHRNVLNRITSDGKLVTLNDGLGLPGWEMTLCLLLAWVFISIALSSGIKSSGKVVYFTATFPYAIVIVMIGIGATLPGSGNGVLYYITPNFKNMLNIATWKLAAEQIFYSTGIGFGSLMTMSSYNGFHDNTLRDCIVVALINSFTSIFAGFAVFEVLGYMACKSNTDVSKVGMSGPGLIFIAYPDGLSTVKGANFFTILLFLMVFTLGVDSQIAMLETVITGISDEFSNLFNTRNRRRIFVLVVCASMFLFDLLLITPQGIYYFTILDSMASSYSLMIVTVCEIIAICYIYGFQKFCGDIYMMLKYKVSYYWIFCWLVISPIAIIFIFIYSVIKIAPLSYGSDKYKHVFPPWAQGMGWIICITAVIGIPIYFVYFFIISYRENPALTFWQVFKLTFRENDEWGPTMKSNWLDSKRYRDKIRRIQTDRKKLYNEIETDIGEPLP